MVHKRWSTLAGLLVVVGLLLTACGTTPTQAPATTAAQTKAPTTQAPQPTEPLKTPEPAPEPKTMVVCMGQEPDTLYTWGGSMLASRHVQHAFYDYPYTSRTYSYQPVILEKLPSLQDGDAVVSTVTVQEGDRVLDDTGTPVDLAKGTVIRPTGCRSSDCAITFDGTPVEMDQIVATFKLLPNLKWSDGEPLTADDAVYGYELVGDPDTPAAKYTYERTTSFVAKDELTAVWTGLPGYMDSTYFINFWIPQPRHLWQTQLHYTAKDLVSAEESSRMPIGWGPFNMKEWVAGDHITVEKNPLYFRASEGLPLIDTVVFRVIKDSNAAIAQLISGECDIVTQDVALEDQAQLLLQLEEQGVIVPVFLTGTSREHLDFGIDPVESYDRPDFFKDVRVRQAIAYCLNRQEVVDTILYGRSIVLDGYVPPEHPLYAGDMLTTYPYDPDKGKALLEEVGWKDIDGDGVREAQGVAGIKDGTKFEVKWQSTTASFRVQYMQIFQNHLTECGLKVNLENMPATQYFASGPDGPVFGRQFDLASFTTSTGVEPPCDSYASWLIPNEVNGWDSDNDPGFNNPEYDAACRRALQALPGTEDYIQGHKEAQRIYSEQIPALPLFLRLKIAAYRPNVVGFIMDPTENSEMWNIEAMDIQP